MLSYIAGILIVAAVIYIIWKSWTENGMDWWKGIGALAALLAGLLIMAADWLKTVAQ